MAAGLAEQIRDKFGIKAVLEEGHDGIYEVRLDKKIVYSNRNRCSDIKSEVEILWSIGKYADVRPGKKLMQPLTLM